MCNSGKTPEHFGLHALLWLSMHHTGNVFSTNSSASNDVPVPRVCPPQGGGWKGQWGQIRISVGGSKGITPISVDTIKNEEQDHSCSKVSDKTCRSKRPGHF